MGAQPYEVLLRPAGPIGSSPEHACRRCDVPEQTPGTLAGTMTSPEEERAVTEPSSLATGIQRCALACEPHVAVR
jgi:hypothetical protein